MYVTKVKVFSGIKYQRSNVRRPSVVKKEKVRLLLLLLLLLLLFLILLFKNFKNRISGLNWRKKSIFAGKGDCARRFRRCREMQKRQGEGSGCQKLLYRIAKERKQMK